MSQFYKRFKAMRIVFYVFCILTTNIFISSSHAASDALFNIHGVTVDVTAENAAAAREQAFMDAQSMAFRKLAERLLSESQLEYFEMPQGSVISTLVKDFELSNEKLSDVRYIGTYNFRFQGDAVRNFLGANGFAYSDVSSKPVLVLPFYQWGAQTIIWGEQNPWMQAWSNSRLYQGLVPVIIPIGDLQDVADIDDEQALTYDPVNLNNMVSRYLAGEAIIMQASPSWNSKDAASNGATPDKMTIMLYRTDRGEPEFANRLTVSQADIVGDEDIFTAAVRVCRSHLQNSWKSKTLTSAAQNNNLKVRVKFNTMKEWVETQKILRGVQGVNNMKLISLNQNEANVELQFQGTQDRLKLALAQEDMTLSASSAPQQQYGYEYNGYGGYQKADQVVYDLYLNKYRPLPYDSYR